MMRVFIFVQALKHYCEKTNILFLYSYLGIIDVNNFIHVIKFQVFLGGGLISFRLDVLYQTNHA